MRNDSLSVRRHLFALSGAFESVKGGTQLVNMCLHYPKLFILLAELALISGNLLLCETALVPSHWKGHNQLLYTREEFCV